MGLLMLLLLVPEGRAQEELWEASFGGDADDGLQALQQTRDGGYILGGTSKSDRGGDKSQDNQGDCQPDVNDPQVLVCPTDFWVVKVDSLGVKQWDKTFGGLQNDDLAALVQTPDGGYLLGGTSVSGQGGDKSQDSRGGADFWIVRLDADGNKLWDKTLGGKRHDQLRVIRLTADGGFVVGGYSNSGIGGDKSETTLAACPPEKVCTPDFWVLKFDAAGNKQWDKTFGGRAEDLLQALHQTPDGGFALAGISWSGIGGDKTAIKQGRADYWLVKIDAQGQKTWDKSYGSFGRELLQDMQPTSDGGYILGGYVSHGQTGDITGVHHGDSDYWVIKVDDAGNKQWDKTFGGRDPDYFRRLQPTPDGGYLLLGQSYSILSGDKTWKRNGPWVIKLDSLGNKQWDKVFGNGLWVLEPTRDGNFILGGNTGESFFLRDYYILKINAGTETPELVFRSFAPEQGLPGSQVILRGENMFKTASVWFHGGKLKKAKYTIVNNTTLLAVVPPAAKTGPVYLVTTTDTVRSAGIFEVLHPLLLSFSPGQGEAGSSVVLKGKNLVGTREVYFNGVATRNFKVASREEVVAVVPAGATTGKVSLVLAGGHSAISAGDFIIVPAKAPPGARLNLSLQEGQADKQEGRLPEGLAKVQAYPNPFQGQVTLQFSLGQSLPASVKVFDLLGREVKELFRQEARAGERYEAVWQPAGSQAAGVYYIRLQTPASNNQVKVLLNR
ncbi:MAG: T9SS type A sorting domain-containing protein [Adhaeribacter sp.]